MSKVQFLRTHLRRKLVQRMHQVLFIIPMEQSQYVIRRHNYVSISLPLSTTLRRTLQKTAPLQRHGYDRRLGLDECSTMRA